MNNQAEKIIQKHLNSDSIIRTVSMTTNYKTHNNEMKKLSKLFNITSKDENLCNEVYSVLLNSDNEVTLLTASTECLKLNIFIEKAESNLKKLIDRKDLGIISFNAEMTLKVWKGEVTGKKLR